MKIGFVSRTLLRVVTKFLPVFSKFLQQFWVQFV